MRSVCSGGYWCVVLFLLVVPAWAGGVRDVDFQNFDYRWESPVLGAPTNWEWLRALPGSTTIRVRDGRRDFDASKAREGTYAGGYVMVAAVAYGDLDGDGVEDAAVDLRFSTGGTLNWHYLYVFSFSGRSAELIAVLRSGSRAYGGLIRTAIEGGVLRLDFLDGERQIGDCCSEGFVRVRYVWRGGRFVESGPRELGDLPRVQP